MNQPRVSTTVGRCLGAACLVLALLPRAATAGYDQPESWEGSIDFAATGGSMLRDTCSPFPNLADPTRPSCNPPGDLQGDTPLTTSEAELYGIPEDAVIIKAYLVYMASMTEGGARDLEVTLAPPGGNNYTIWADDPEFSPVIEPLRYQDDFMAGSMAWFNFYTVRLDITETLWKHAEVQGKPLNGVYTFGNMDVSTQYMFLATTGILGGWSVLVVYGSESIARKKVYLYTGFQRGQDELIRLLPAGFIVPENPRAKVTFFLGEGDANMRGRGPSGEATHSEELKFNGTVLSDYCNPADNQYNSTVNTNIRPDEQPCRVNQFSIDLDTFDISQYVRYGDTACTVDLTLGQDQVFTNYLIISIDTKLPDFDIPGHPEKLSSVDDIGYLFPGQQFEYRIDIQNWGEDTAYNIFVFDRIPAFTAYVPGSTTLDGAPVPDVGGQCPLSAGTGLKVADSMQIGAAHGHTVRFSVRVLTENEGVDKETKIYNTAEIRSEGSEVYVTNGGIPLKFDIVPKSYEGTLVFARGPHSPPAGYAPAGAADLPLLQLRLETRTDDVLLRSLTLLGGGSGDETTDITTVRLYEDRDHDGRVGPGDGLIRDGLAFPSPDGELTVTGLGRALSAGESIDLLVACDLSAEAAPGTTFQISVIGSDLLGRAEGLPVDGPVLRIPAADVSLSLGGRSPAAGRVAPGSTFAATQIVAISHQAAEELTGVVLSAAGSLQPQRDTTGVRLLWDANADGMADAGDLPLGQAAFDADGRAAFAGLGLILDTGVPVHLVAEVTLGPQVFTGRTIAVGVDDPGDVTLANGSSVEGPPFYGSEQTVREQGTDGDAADGDLPADGDSPADGDAPADGDQGGGTSSGGCGHIPAAPAATALLTALALAARRRG